MRNYRFMLVDVKVKGGTNRGNMIERGMVLAEAATLKALLLKAREWKAEHKIGHVRVEKDRVILENSSFVYECYVEKERFEELNERDLQEIKAELIYEL